MRAQYEPSNLYWATCCAFLIVGVSVVLICFVIKGFLMDELQVRVFTAATIYLVCSYEFLFKLIPQTKNYFSLII